VGCKGSTRMSEADEWLVFSGDVSPGKTPYGILEMAFEKSEREGE